jgi:hypothetical protein
MVQPPPIFGNNRMSDRPDRPDGPLNPGDSDRAALRRRVKQFYLLFNEGDWEGCLSLIDPQLRDQGRVELATYSERMRTFKEAYGAVRLWHTRLNLHLDASSASRDKRPFAYVYVIWQDEAHGFHMFRERWVKENGRWYTRVVGLVPNKQTTGSTQD